MSKLHGSGRGRVPRLVAVVPIGCLWVWASAAVGDVELRFELPDGELGRTAYWGVVQGGRLSADGSFSCTETQQHTVRVGLDEGEAAGGAGPVGEAGDDADAGLADGAATLIVSINHDGYESYFPSFGDLWARAAFTVGGGGGRVVVQRSDWRERTLSDPANLVTVHYHRFDADYQTAGVWTWDEHNRRMPAEQETFAVGRDEYGVVFQIDTAEYGDPGDRIGLLPRMNGDWQFKDGPDRFWSAEIGPHAYLVQGSSDVYGSPPDVSPKIVSAVFESETEVAVSFTHRLPAVDFPAERFTIRRVDGAEEVTVAAVTPEGEEQGKAGTFRVRTSRPMRMARDAYEIAARSLAGRRVDLVGPGFDIKRFDAPGAVLGAQYTPGGTTFRVFSPLAEGVEVIVAATPTGPDGLAARAMSVDARGVWSVTVAADLAGKFYAYRLRGPELDPQREVTDIYAVCTAGPQARALIVDRDKTDPPGFDPTAYVNCPSAVDAVIYEMHVRDFTIADNSGVGRKGKFLGLTEPGTHLPGDPSIKTGLDHLVELGVTHVQILPIQDFDNKEAPDDSYNWGYMPVFFNSPDGWYATAPVGPQRITEFKQLVQTLHERGIGVIMDVVYNHVADWASFERLVPGYYLRRRPDGTLWNGSGCGNELASERPMARKYMVDSVKYWVAEYGIDGFRFDLMGLHDLETMLAIREELRKINPSVLIYGEPWTGGASGLKQVTDQRRVAGTGLAAFNDHFRDAVKGDRDGGQPGFVQIGDRMDRIRQGIRANIGDWAKQPTDCLTYCECHDNLTTWDKLIQSAPEATDEVRKRMQRFAGLLVLTSQGIPFIHSGQELCRSKQGHHNSYNLPDSVNQIDWSLKQANQDVFAYYRGLIALRKAHPVLRLRTADEIRQRLSFRRNAPSDRCLAYRLDGTDLPGESHRTTLVLLNGDATDQEFRLAPGAWRVLVDADRAGTEPLGEVTGKVTVKAHSGMVLGQ